jgi:hypothetical protein
MAFDPLSSLLDVGKALIDKLIPDPQAKAAATQKLLEMQQNGDLAVIAAQSHINEIEAANPNLFVSGWRPAVGWVCVFGFAVMCFAPLMGCGPRWTSGRGASHSHRGAHDDPHRHARTRRYAYGREAQQRPRQPLRYT